MLSAQQVIGTWRSAPFGAATKIFRVFKHVTLPDGSSFDLCAMRGNKAAPVRATLFQATAYGDQTVSFVTGGGGYLNLEITHR
jgi:hypothetical protein